MPFRVPPLRLTDTTATIAVTKTTGPITPLNNISIMKIGPASPVSGE